VIFELVSECIDASDRMTKLMTQTTEA
jgi:hypothetical protein